MKFSICKMCKEPLWSFICTDCFAADMKRSLQPQVRQRFDDFYSRLFSSFVTEKDISFESCLHCHELKEACICTYCFINELVSWFKDRGMPTSFIFHFEDHRFESSYRNDRWIPVSRFMCDQRIEGLCDLCSEFEDNLASRDGRWICEECAENYEPESVAVME